MRKAQTHALLALCFMLHWLPGEYQIFEGFFVVGEGSSYKSGLGLEQDRDELASPQCSSAEV